MSTSYENESLPKDEKGRTYVTDSMLEDNPGLVTFLQRTESSWWRDDICHRYVMYPRAGNN